MAYIDDVYLVVNIAPVGIPTYVRLSQNENGRRLYFAVAGGEIPSGSTATMSGTKPDGVVYSKAGTVSGNTVIFSEDIQLTAVAGEWPAKIVIVNGGQTVMTARIRFVIDADPVAAGAVPSDSQLEGLVAQAAAYAEAAKDGAFYGSPLVASTVAEMTDQTRVYVYTGSESGYTSGNWYYWDGSAWTSGGVYNATAVSTDTTLSIAGKAADAKVVGDEIADLKDDLTTIEQEVESIIPGLSEDAKVALLSCFQNVAWSNGSGQIYYEALYDALYESSGLVRITAMFEQGTMVVTPDTPLNDLKANLTVTGYYNDGTTKVLTNYALIGSLVVGVSTVTVSSNNISTTFSVNVIGLPSGYTECDAIIAGSVNTGTNANEVETDYYVNQNSRITAKCRLSFSWSATPNNGTCSLFTDHSASGYGFAYTKTENLGRKRYSLYRGGINYKTPYEGDTGAITIDDTAVYTYDIYQSNTIVRDNETIISDVIDGGLTSGNHMHILGDVHVNSELYYLKVYEGEMLVRYYLPCIRESDSMVGLYDIVGGGFFSNANWTAKTAE